MFWLFSDALLYATQVHTYLHTNNHHHQTKPPRTPALPDSTIHYIPSNSSPAGCSSCTAGWRCTR